MKVLSRSLASFVLLIAAGCAHADPPSTPVAPAETGKLVVHYHRFDGNYDTPGLWTWDARKQKDPVNQEVLSTGKSDYGVSFEIDLSQYGNDDGPDEQIGFIPRMRRDWGQKDGTDRTWTPAQGYEIWLIGNDPRIYTERPDTSPKIDLAFIDAPNRISLVLSTPLTETSATNDSFTVTDAAGSPFPIKAVRLVSAQGNQSKLVDVELTADMDFLASTYTVKGTDYRSATAALRRVLDDPLRFYSDKPMGVVYTPESSIFRLFSPTARSVKAVLYANPTGNEGRREYPMERGSNGVWEANVSGDLLGRHYKYIVASDRYGELEINDPNATNTTGDDGAARITDLRALDPAGFRPIRRPVYGSAPTDAIIYQMHVRDFTTMASSNVTPSNRGKFLGLTEPNTSLAADPSITTALAHLKELGVTHVQIQPFHDWDNDEDKPDYNWGYMTAFFNSPEGSLSSDIRTDARIAETKQMIKALKDANIGVILDVVYNHTGVQNTFEKSAPGYFLRMKPDGSFWNGSGTGNEFRSEAPMARRFIIDSLKMWMTEYGIDGFRFDLMGLLDLETLRQAQAELKAEYPGALIYGEPWAAAGPDGVGISRITYKDLVKGTGLAAFNDHFRDSIKGSPDGNDPGYIVNGSRREGIMKGIAGSIDDWAANPLEAINYADVHDNLILYDKLKYSAPDYTEDERARMQMLSGGILSVSQGIMLIHTGADFLRSKQGNHNSYNSGDEINGVRWELKKEHHDVFEYYKGVIAIRKAHPLFRLSKATDVRARLKFHDDRRPAPETIVFTVSGAGLEGETWAEALVLINPTRAEQKFPLPADATWEIFALDKTADTTAQGSTSGALAVPAHSLAILARKAE